MEQGIVPFEFLKSHRWDTKLKSDAKDDTISKSNVPIHLDLKNNTASNSNVPIHTDDKFCVKSETHDLPCTQLESCAFSETSPKERNHCEPLV